MADPRNQSHAEWIADYEGENPGKVIPHALNEHKPQAALNDANAIEKRGKTPPRRQGPKIVPPDDMAVLIPEGRYTAKCYDYKFCKYWGKSRLNLKFEINQGRFAGTRLECFYNLDREKNPNGEYILAPRKRRAYVRLMKQMFNEVFEAQGDWLSPENLCGKTFRVDVITVIKNHAKEALGCNQYSKVNPGFELINE